MRKLVFGMMMGWGVGEGGSGPGDRVVRGWGFPQSQLFTPRSDCLNLISLFPRVYLRLVSEQL